jgi:transcription elongation factor SPT5
MSKKFFRPPPQAFEDDEDDDDYSENENSDASNENEETRRANKQVNANLSDDDGSDEDEDDEESEENDDDEEEEEHTHKRKKSGASQRAKKKPKASSFFDMEAEASDDEEEEDYGHRKDGEHLDAEAQEIIRQQDRRRAMGGRFGDRSVAEITREIENRHKMQSRTIDRSKLLDRALPERERRIKPSVPAGVMAATTASLDERESEVGYTAAVAQQSLVPSVSDPSLWMVSCATGKEQELVLQIMNKCISFARQGRPLGISAAVAAQSKGKIYIESFSEPAVKEAVQGVRGLLQYTMKLVPIHDMTTVMTVVSKKKPVKKNEWVRMTRGHYKGDLALVRSVKESGLKCIVQCVPRLDLTLADLPPEEARIRRRTVRPPQKFFSAQEVAALGRQSLRRQRFPGMDIYCDYFEGNYYDNGYLLKEMTVGSMVKPCTEEDPPSLDELEAFRRRKKVDGDDGQEEENIGSKIAASLLDELAELQGKTGAGKNSASPGGLLIGDTIEVIEGDLVGMRGKLVSLDENTVKVKPSDNSVDLGGTSEVEFLINQVRKYIAVGAHVKVTEGRYANETGVVVAVEHLEGESDFTAVVLTDITNKEISVRTSQLRESAEVASGQDKLSGYELYDLVVLSGGGSANEVGVIVRVGREDFTVINNHGITREIRPEELRGKKNSISNRAVALDVQGNQLRVGDTVNVAEGPHKGKSATIKRMSRAQLFLHSQTRSEHAGIFVVRSRSCVLSGGKSQSRGSGVEAGVSPFATPQTSQMGPPAARGKRDDGIIGKTVRIQAGEWKGYIGTVSDATATHVQVELHSRLKKVMVVRERVIVVGDKFGATENQNQAAISGGAFMPAALATPMHTIGGATPAIHGFGGTSPNHDIDNQDEVWRPGGAVDEAIKEDDGWGTSQNDDGNANEENDGWGTAENTSSWGSSLQKKEESVSSTAPQEDLYHTAIKREQTKSELDTGVADIDETPVWFMERVFVSLKENSKQAVIKEINPDKSALVELEDKSSQLVRVSDVSMVAPVEHDTVLVTGGNEIGLEGSLVCVDGKFIVLMIFFLKLPHF